MQSRGFNGFSYADVAAELSITKASLHYHFPGKAELGEALIERYAARFAEALGGDRRARRRCRAPSWKPTPASTRDVLRDKRMCLCGMLAAEYQTLPEPMRDAVIGFFDDNEAWLVSVLSQGQADHLLEFSGPPGETARMIISGLEGAMLVARPYGDIARFQAAADRLLSSVAGTPN